MTPSETMSRDRWHACLVETFDAVSEHAPCRSILAELGTTRLQLLFDDRPEMNYWEDYRDGRVTPHLGTCDGAAVEISTTFPVLLDTLLSRMSIMEAAADEVYDLRGDTTTLMKCANLLPYVMAAFSRTYARRFAGDSEAAK
ncbi:hypothetical protein [Bradyrhizobium diazoefficiens]|uniref:hypothetical protein n=1 Tax=Bradyrhizobium diazoefficiens TaxID=1355477 RepID=UPI0035957774